MKPQDLVFCLILSGILIIRKYQLFVYCGLFSFIISIILYIFGLLFTAERLIWYAAGYIFTYLLIYLSTYRRLY
jgi:hypothetical protein